MLRLYLKRHRLYKKKVEALNFVQTMNNRKERIAIKNAISDKNWLVEWPLDDISHLRACTVGEGLLGYVNFSVEFVTLGQLITSNCLSKHIRISNNNRSFY